MKVYIAGAITNNPNYKEQFKAAEERLIAEGHSVINPCKNDGFTYREYINMGLCELMHCDAIYLLKGYETSTGATLEHDYARTVGLKVLMESDTEYEVDDVLLDTVIEEKCVIGTKNEYGYWVIYADGSCGFKCNEDVEKNYIKTGERLSLQYFLSNLKEG